MVVERAKRIDARPLERSHRIVPLEARRRAWIELEIERRPLELEVNAIRALRAWRFEELAPGTTGEQWGSITMKYRLDDAGIE